MSRSDSVPAPMVPDEHNCEWKDEAVAQREYAEAVIASTKSRKRAAEELAKAEQRGRSAALAEFHNTHKFTNEKNPDKCDVCGLAEIAAYCSECKRLINGRLYEHQVGHHGWGKEDN